ncbi:MAG TPA: hypothetical protein VMW58_03100 [Anaerolineae bacterium]|nr:hypothetical protein [Anaerolineae bacterium]
MITDVTMQRLAFIRYLYTRGVEASRRPEPLSAASVLTFHDSIELFLELASEHLDVGGKNPAFMKYWELLKPKLPDDGLTQQEAMRRLNKSRVALKHHGTLPSRLDIEAFRATSTSFFEENTPLVFGIDFTSVSMTRLVQDAQARVSLEQADLSLREKDDREEALGLIAIAFHQVVDGWEHSKRGDLGYSPFFFGKRLTLLDSFSIKVIYPELATFIHAVKDSIESMQSAMKILSFGLDYRRYVKFRLLTPGVVGVYEGGYTVHGFERDDLPSLDDCRFCYDFVVECAIHLQTFDFEL